MANECYVKIIPSNEEKVAIRPILYNMNNNNNPVNPEMIQKSIYQNIYTDGIVKEKFNNESSKNKTAGGNRARGKEIGKGNFEKTQNSVLRKSEKEHNCVKGLKDKKNSVMNLKNRMSLKKSSGNFFCYKNFRKSNFEFERHTNNWFKKKTSEL